MPPPRSWLRDPLLHFLVLGIAAATLYLAADRPSEVEAREPIVLTEGDIAWLRSSFERTWQRPPFASELDGLIEARVREEVMFREALRLGLDRDDAVVRRRLAQKLEFIAKDLGAGLSPTDEELRERLEERRAEYTTPPRRSLVHVYFNPERRGPSVEEDARTELERLRASEALTPEQLDTLGDRFLLRTQYPPTSQTELAREFGAGFAEAVFEVEPGIWSGPVRSGYGLHLVLVVDVEEARLPDFEVLRPRLLDDLVEERREANLERFYAELGSRYPIRIERTTE